MGIFEMVMVGIGIIVGLIVLTVLAAFLIELVKAFAQMWRKDDDGGTNP